MKRTDYCGRIDGRHLKQVVTLAGWVHRRRDHGGVIFVDLRDREGLVQVVFDPDRAQTFATAEKLRNEFCIRVSGVVRPRPEGTVNPNLVSGEIEVLGHEIEILNPSVTPPFQLDDENLSETVRLQHRVIDLRRPAMQANLRLRHRAAMAARRFLDDAGFDRYYQIVKCFRDEDNRADRQPEFTQIDIEMSFADELEIRAMMEGLVRAMFREALATELPEFPILTYADVMRDYGSDKPDLRIPLKLTELTDVAKTVDFKVFRAAADLPNGRVAALRVPNGGAMTRKQIDDYAPFVAVYGAKGLAWIKVNDATKPNEQGLQSPIVKFLSETSLRAILERTGAQTGDVIFFGADRKSVADAAMGALRARVGHDLGLAQPGWKPLWVVDFPMFEHKEDTGSWGALHHPFTAPKDGHEDRFERDPGSALAKAYDVVLNGWEIGGGSVRIHRADVQAKVFAALKISPEDQRRKFGFLLDALSYGAPPHGGIAFGFDRIVAMMAGVEQIRDVIAFPKTQRQQDLLVDAPTPVTEQQLRDLHIRVRQSDAAKLG